MDFERNLAARTRAAADLDELMHDALSCLGGARHAGVDPEALRGVVGCAAALGADSLTTYTAGDGWPAGHPDEDVFLSHTDDIGTDIAARLRSVLKLDRETTTALEAAHSDLDDARTELRAARAALVRARLMPVTWPCQGCHARRAAAVAEAQDRIEEAKADIEAAQQRIRVCQECARILGEVIRRLRRALARIQAVRPDMAEVYERVHDWRRRHGPEARLADEAREFHTGAGVP